MVEGRDHTRPQPSATHRFCLGLRDRDGRHHVRCCGSNGAAWFGDLRFLADASMIRMDSGITSCAFPTKGSEVTFAGAAGLYFCQPVIGAS